jgi:hypothetical protein
MEERAKLWIKRFSGISLVLILIFVASYGHSTQSIIEKMDVDENHIMKLETGEQGAVDLSKIGYYVAFRFEENGNDLGPELKLIDSVGVEIEGREPGRIESNNKRPDSEGSLVYVPVRVFEITNDAEYNLINEGNTTLWLVNDLDIQSSLLSDEWIIVSMLSCCLGFPMGIITLIVGLILWRRKKLSPGKEIILQGNIMTTDELFKKHNSIPEEEEIVPPPFVEPSDKWEDWDGGE